MNTLTLAKIGRIAISWSWSFVTVAIGLALFVSVIHSKSSPLITPNIEFTFVPPFGSVGVPLRGRVTKVTPANFRVAVYIFIPGLGWYTKPSCANPLTLIQNGGDWETNIVSGGVDDTATQLAAFLVPASFNHPCVLGAAGVPPEVAQQSVASVVVTRTNPNERQVHFSGHDWAVKSNRVRLGPGPNYFSDSTDNVWVDAQGRLHLKITNRNGLWFCPEIVAKTNFGYGTYRWFIDTPVDGFDPNVVLGLYTWSEDPAYTHREIDIEFSKWAETGNPNNSQFVVQPFTDPQNIHRFAIPAGINNSTHSFNWSPRRILFQSLREHHAFPPNASYVLRQWVYDRQQGIPLSADETPRLNLWLVNGSPPLNNLEVEVIISRFQFIKTSAFDFDSDGRADLSVRRPTNNIWYLLQGTAGFTAITWGQAGDKIAPADYDGDGKSDVAVFRPSTGQWYVVNSSNLTFVIYNWGQDGDLPVPTDRDNDGRSDLVLFRPSNNTWYPRSTATGPLTPTQFGVAGDKPMVGDFDADGIGDIALFRPSNNNWYIIKSSLGFFVQTWGEAGDIPTTGDFDGDGATDQAVFRPGTGQWFLSRTTAGFSSQFWGQSGDIPVAADYDGDGKTDVAVFRPSNATWYIVNSTAGIQTTQFGQTGDVPTQSSYLY